MNHQPYSYRDDPDVPEFSDDGPRTVMDAKCAVCSAGARWISRNDRFDVFRIIPMQSELGKALLQHYGLDPSDPSTWLYLEDGRAFTSLDAVIRVATRLGGPWKGVRILQALPRRVQDFLYRTVARNRYRIWGKGDLCAMPDREIQKRLLQ